jgi:hypothetical protein
MFNLISRRGWLKAATLTFPALVTTFPSRLIGASMETPATSAQPLPDLFPTQPPELIRELVTVAHFDLKRVQELVDARPSLARAAWDWGFGDWETPLGAASHMGNRPIAEYLIQKGARPSLFSAAMLGQLDVVKAFVAAHSHIERIEGPHSISLLAHAKAGGETARPVFEYLQTLGDAGATPVAPLSDAEIASIVGNYTYGLTGNQQIDVTADHGQLTHLTWTRKGTMGRMLFHLGNRVFYPGGASAVRIHFEDDKQGTLMTIHDPDPVLRAHRKSESS